LHNQDLVVSVVNPRRTSAYANSRLARSKTDQVDARLLARFCRREEPSPWHPASSQQRDLKEMTRGLESLKKERDRLKNQIEQSSNPKVTGSLQSVLESVNDQIDRLEEGDLRSPASMNTFKTSRPSPGSETFWKRSLA
jgi:transposase